MPVVTVDLRSVPGTQAALGWAGGHTMVVDRPQDRAGGMGLGFNGAQLLALTIGGCFCNDLRYVADELGVALGDISVEVALTLEGEPLIATGATMTVHCRTLDGSDPASLVETAKKTCMVSNSLARGVPVVIGLAAQT